MRLTLPLTHSKVVGNLISQTRKALPARSCSPQPRCVHWRIYLAPSSRQVQIGKHSVRHVILSCRNRAMAANGSLERLGSSKNDLSPTNRSRRLRCADSAFVERVLVGGVLAALEPH